MIEYMVLKIVVARGNAGVNPGILVGGRGFFFSKAWGLGAALLS